MAQGMFDQLDNGIEIRERNVKQVIQRIIEGRFRKGEQRHRVKHTRQSGCDDREEK